MKINTSKQNKKLIDDLNYGDVFMADSGEYYMLVENNNEEENCVNLKTGLLVVIDIDTEVEFFPNAEMVL